MSRSDSLPASSLTEPNDEERRRGDRDVSLSLFNSTTTNKLFGHVTKTEQLFNLIVYYLMNNAGLLFPLDNVC